MDRKAVAMISGGLDSALAAKLILDQGIEVVGLYCSVPWGCCDKSAAYQVAKRLGIEFLVIKLGGEYIEVLRNPRYPRGVQMNPCVDCRMHMFGKAKQVMAQVGASFLVTGEVIGQRPMSQMRDRLATIEREAGLERLIVRPLSAQLLEPTIPEEAGVVDRSKLLAIAGRSRKEQLALAVELGVSDYSQPAGGCLLTDEPFANKVRDLFHHEPRNRLIDMELLQIGRHFRIDEQTRIVLGRDEYENGMLEYYAQMFGEEATLFKPEFPGPSALAVGLVTDEVKRLVGRLILCYSKYDLSRTYRIALRTPGAEEIFVAAEPLDRVSADAMRVEAGPGTQSRSGDTELNSRGTPTELSTVSPESRRHHGETCQSRSKE